MQVAEPDDVILHRLTECPRCQTRLEAEAAERHEKRQVFDIPPARIEVTEHQAEVRQCPGCGACVKGEFPADVSQPTRYGPRLKALACYLYSQQFNPLAGIRELLTALYGDALSAPVVLAAARQLASRTQASLEQIRQQLVAAAVVHMVEQYGQAWAAKMERLLCDIKAEVALTSELQTALSPHRLSYYEAEYDVLIAQGFAANPFSAETGPRPTGRPKQSPSKDLLDRLHKHKAGVLAFIWTSASPLTTTSSNAMCA